MTIEDIWKKRDASLGFLERKCTHIQLQELGQSLIYGAQILFGILVIPAIVYGAQIWEPRKRLHVLMIFHMYWNEA